MKKTVLMVLVTIGLFLLSCSSLQSQVQVSPEQKTVNMKASDFKFEPNNLSAAQGDTITFRIENTSGSEHNFTLKDPKGQVSASIDIPAHKTIETKARFNEEGTYPFDCNKPFHSKLGMKGQVVVGKP